MPFLWQLMATEGSIAGDRSAGSSVQLRNRLWFSYPGYAEILLGEPHDDEIKSNDPVRNPYTTVLERLREALGLPREKVATFGSWGVFNAIAEHVEGATVVNAGLEPLGGGDPGVRLLDDLQREARPPWGGHPSRRVHLPARHASPGDRAAARALHRVRRDRRLGARRPLRPRARRLRPDRRLPEAAVDVDPESTRLPRSDAPARSPPTTAVAAPRADWRTHGAKAAGSRRRLDRDGLAAPDDSAASGTTPPALTTSQIAATLAGWMGVDWNAERPGAGRPIQ